VVVPIARRKVAVNMYEVYVNFDSRK
jgi:hypothetical protein